MEQAIDYRTELLEQRNKLAIRKQNLEKEIKETGITTRELGNAKYAVSNDVWERRKRLGREMRAIDAELSKVRSELSLVENARDKDKAIFKEVLNGIFTSEQVDIIMNEIVRRKNGEVPLNLHITAADTRSLKETIRKLKNLCRDTLDSAIETRNVLTDIMNEGMARYGKEEFSKLMLPINKLLMPVATIQRIKRENNV